MPPANARRGQRTKFNNAFGPDNTWYSCRDLHQARFKVTCEQIILTALLQNGGGGQGGASSLTASEVWGKEVSSRAGNRSYIGVLCFSHDAESPLPATAKS